MSRLIDRETSAEVRIINQRSVRAILAADGLDHGSPKQAAVNT